MIRTTLQVRIFVCTEPTDMRRSFDGLCGMTRELIRQDPLSGAFFLFRNRSRDRLKILYWHRDGLAIQNSAAVNIDETGWQENGLKGWLWTAVCRLGTLFSVPTSRSRSRSRAMATDLLGDQFRGVVVSDRYSAYSHLEDHAKLPPSRSSHIYPSIDSSGQ